MKIVRVWMLFAIVTGMTLGGCETGESPRDNDVAPPSRVAVVKPPAPPSETAARKPSAHSSPRASMNRLMREIEGKAPLPKESRVADLHPEDHTQPRAPASGSTGTCPPAEYKKGGKFPNSIKGIGEGKDKEAAKARARLNIAEVFGVEITSQFTDQARETTDRGFEASVESKIVERVELLLPGVSMSPVVECGDKKKWYYALAALDLEGAKVVWGDAKRKLDEDVKRYCEKVKNNAVSTRLWAWYQLAVALKAASQIETRLTVLKVKPALTDKPESDSHCRSAKSAKDSFDDLLKSITVKRVSGNRQQAVKSKYLPYPFEVEVLAGEEPVKGVTVIFKLDKGNIEVVPDRADTKGDGKASVSGFHINHKPIGSMIHANVRLDLMIPMDLRDDLKAEVEEKQKNLPTVKFSVEPPVFHLIKKVKPMVEKAEDLDKVIKEHKKNRNILGMMEEMAKLYKEQKKGKQLYEDLHKYHKLSAEKFKILKDHENTRSKLKNLFSSFQFEVVGGNKQEASVNGQLKEVLKAKLTAKLGEKEKVPVKGVRVQFKFDQNRENKGDRIKPRAWKTNGEGETHATVLEVKPGNKKSKSTFVTVSLADNRLQWLAELLDREFTSIKEGIVNHFSITRPWCGASDPFNRKLYAMACELVAKGVRDEDPKKPKTVVRGFTKAGSKQRYSLSNRIEESLRGGLALTKELTVLRSSNSGDASASSDAVVTVEGTYQFYNKQKFLVSANFLTQGGVVRGSAETSIPLKELGNDDKRAFTDELRTSSSSAPPLPVVPDPSGLTHDEWVETFWTHLNPRAVFSTEVQPEKKTYHEGDHPTFSFRTDRDCYLWVFAVGKTGNVYMLIPNYHNKNKKPRLVHEGEEVLIPDPTGKIRLTIKHPFGEEKVKTICTEHHIDIVAPHHVDELTNKDNPVLKFSRENGRFSFVKAVSLTGAGEWSEARTTVITLPKGQTMTRGMRGLRDLGLVSTEE